ncbi:g6811 [Coccomyxa viridis]|uniref:G6811 protein n=1 Tax=Coccomyxa viridis TaxID=1274662 RepID=A0ABP1FXI8_9CHLO
MANIDFAELAKDPIYVGLVMGLLGIVVYFAMGRKSFGPVPKNVKSYAKIPGPFCLPIVGNLLSFASFTPTAHLTWSSWAKAFGKIYKYDVCGARYDVCGARYVVVSDPKVLPVLLSSEKFTMDTHSAAVAGSLSKEAHAAIAPAFSTEGAKLQFDTTLKKAVELAESIDKNGPDTPTDMQKALEDVVLDAVLTSAFDATPEKLEEVRKPVKASLHAMALKAARPVSNPFGFLMAAGPPVETPKSKKAWLELVKALRKRGPASKSDPSLAAGLMRLTGAGGAPVSDEELARQAALVAANALQPTAQTVAWTLFNIATTPSLQDGIAKELSEAGLLAHGQEREPRLPSYDDVQKLPYLNAVIKESQRLFPAAVIGPIRMAAENAELGGYFIPKGTRVQVPLHTLHTAAWNWPQPERVWPERWTSVDATGAPKNGAGTDGLNSAFLPWGAACPSTSVSEVQVAVIVAVMASRFKLALASGGRKAALERQTLDSILHLKGGMKMIFVPRASIGFSSRL